MLGYPKFRLSPEEREELLSDYLPFCESVSAPSVAPPQPRNCRDPFDVPFLELALSGDADFLVTGDGDLLSLASEFPCPIVRSDEFLRNF